MLVDSGSMNVINGVRDLPSPLAASILTIGNFDGVHRGHQVLLESVVRLARELGVLSVLMTFEPHPVKVLHPDRKLTRIFDFEDQKKCLEAAGLDLLVVEPFSREFSQFPAERFLGEWIYRPFSPRTVIVGYDFSFGADRKGSIEFIRSKSSDFGFSVEVIPPVKVDGEICSSTRIRQAVETGDVELANKLLGRDFYIEGLVERGAGRGRKLGLPTANLRTNAETHPSQGVYAAWAVTSSGRHRAVVNIGTNPTFVHQGHVTIEAHILDFSEDLYGSNLRLEFVKRIRSEKKFSGPTELISQIRKDISESRLVLS